MSSSTGPILVNYQQIARIFGDGSKEAVSTGVGNIGLSPEDEAILGRALAAIEDAAGEPDARLLNQRDGFDCPGCAWPEPREGDGGRRSVAEFCENGAKAVAEEATTRRVGPEFFAAHSLADLDGRSEYWLGQQGRLTHPVVQLLLRRDPPAEQARRQPVTRRRRRRIPPSVVGGPRPGRDPASAAVDRPRVR